jgi:hypothetical protein
MKIDTNLSDNWAYLSFALINDATGDAFDFAREVSYYSGYDSDGSWTEGSKSASITIPHVPAGRYYLRIEPEMEGSQAPGTNSPAATTTPAPSPFSRSRIAKTPAPKSLYYEISLRYKGGSTGWFWLAGFLLLIPPIFYSIRVASFETRRWSTSDYPPVSSS